MNFPADMLPMYTASMSSERSFASWIAFRPASIPRSRKERSHSSPNSVSPTPMTATLRTASALPHQDLAAVLRVRRVLDEHVVLDLRLDRGRRIAPDASNLVRHRDVEPVGAGAAPIPDGEDPVAGFRLVQDGAQPDHDRAAVRVPDLPHAQARVDLWILEAELLRRADRELPVRLVEHGVVVVLRGRAGPPEEELRAGDHVLEVRRLAGEAAAMTRVPLALSPPEVRGVGRVRHRVVDVRDRSVPIRKAAPPADALYSSASPGAPWLVSEPTARPYFIIFERVSPIVVCMAAVPALHANSKSAAVMTAYG